MGRKFIVVVFLSVLSLSVWVFLNRESNQTLNELPSSDKTPRISLEEFTLYKYEKTRASATLSGRFANFVDPDQLEMFGSVQGYSQNKGKREFFTAESATLHFQAKGVVNLVKQSQIEKIEIENSVRFGSENMVLYTEYARYLNLEKKLNSEQPVRIQGQEFDVKGSKGFEYSVDTGDLKVFGPLEGTLKDAEALPQ